MIAGLSLFYAACFVRYLGPLEEYKPVQFFAQTIDQIETDVQAGYFGLTAPVWLFIWINRFWNSIRWKRRLGLFSHRSPVYLIVPASHYRSLVQSTGRPLKM